ncbi:unnamed protein product, partial [Polarella glacialis]
MPWLGASPRRQVVLLAAVLVSAAAAAEEDAEEGNGLCWYNTDKTFRRCCEEGDVAGDCWTGLGFTPELCCRPPSVELLQCYQDMEARTERKYKDLQELEAIAVEEHAAEYADLIAGHAAGYGALLAQPMALWSYACSSTNNPLLWSEGCNCCDPKVSNCPQEVDPSDAVQIRPEYMKCCHPVLTRKTLSPPDETLEASIQEQVARWIPSRKWIRAHGHKMQWDLGPGQISRGCVVSIRDGTAASNCSEACVGFDCSYLWAFKLTLEIINGINPLPDMDLVLNLSDETLDEYGEVPVFTRVGTRWTSTIGLPAEWQMHPGQCLKTIKVGMIATSQVSWEDRAPELIWRGTHSNLWSGANCSIALAAEDPSHMERCMRSPT